MNGPLAGIRVIEIAGEWCAHAGKLLAEAGADVVLVEPPGGHATRGRPPFLNDAPGPERSLWFWHYHAGKRGVTIDLATPDGAAQFRRLVTESDIVLEGEAPGALAALGLDHADLDDGRLIWVSVTPFGRQGPHSPRAGEPATDLTLLAGGGPVWSCGYDDHALPPVRPGGNHALQIGAPYAASAALAALLHRDLTGRGQLIDVSLHAACNVTTEAATWHWLANGGTVQRQTGRHADLNETLPTQFASADGRLVQLGYTPPTAAAFRAMLAWLEQLGLTDRLADLIFLQIGAEKEFLDKGLVGVDPETTEILRAFREAMQLICAHLPAVEFFHGAQRRGFSCAPVYAPDEILTDPQFQARGFATPVWHEELGRAVTYAGPAVRYADRPAARRAPFVGQHNGELL